MNSSNGYKGSSFLFIEVIQIWDMLEIVSITYVTTILPAKVAQFARRVFDVTESDDTKAATEGIARLRSFFHSIGLPITMKELGIENPDIGRLVTKLHENKGPQIGGYLPLDAKATEAIFRLAAE